MINWLQLCPPAQDLPLSELLGGFSDPYIRIALVPSVDERIRQSSVKRKTSNPYYNERFKFPVAFDEVKDKLLVFHIYDYDKFSRHNVIGEVQVDLGKVEISNSVEMWCDIQKHQKVRPSSCDNDLQVSSTWTTISLHIMIMICSLKLKSERGFFFLQREEGSLMWS